MGIRKNLMVHTTVLKCLAVLVAVFVAGMAFVFGVSRLFVYNDKERGELYEKR